MADGLTLAVAGVLAVFLVMLVLMGLVLGLRVLGRQQHGEPGRQAPPVAHGEPSGAEVALLAVALYCSREGETPAHLPEVARRELSLWRQGGG